ncbi:MAG: folate-binding protein YgfZ [Beijerinckiaceae bacterium]
MQAALLEHRGVVRITGEDAADWLQGLITNDIARADGENACFAAFLSPQGKILFDFLIHRRGDLFLLDCAAGQAAALAKRLAMYRLRAKVQVELETGAAVLALWDTASRPHPQALRDPRDPLLGWRLAGEAAALAELFPERVPATDYDAHRIAAGVPEGGTDFAWGDIFPHDANMDEMNGVDFKKGCYVGQEVVSRVQHRGSARKRFRKLHFGGETPAPGTEIMAGETSIGSVTSVCGFRGLGLIRIDRAAEGGDFMAGGAIVGIAL